MSIPRVNSGLGANPSPELYVSVRRRVVTNGHSVRAPLSSGVDGFRPGETFPKVVMTRPVLESSQTLNQEFSSMTGRVTKIFERLNTFYKWIDANAPTEGPRPPEMEMRELANTVGFMAYEEVIQRFKSIPNDYPDIEKLIKLMDIHFLPDKISDIYGIKFYAKNRVEIVISRLQGKTVSLTDKDYLFWCNLVHDWFSFSENDGLAKEERVRLIDIFNKWTLGRLFLESTHAPEEMPPSKEEMIHAAHVCGFMTTEEVINHFGGAKNPEFVEIVKKFLLSHRTSKSHGIDFFEKYRIDNIDQRIVDKKNGRFLSKEDFNFLCRMRDYRNAKKSRTKIKT